MSGSIRYRFRVAFEALGEDPAWTEDFKTLTGAIKRAQRLITRQVKVRGVFRVDRCFADKPAVRIWTPGEKYE